MSTFRASTTPDTPVSSFSLRFLRFLSASFSLFSFRFVLFLGPILALRTAASGENQVHKVSAFPSSQERGIPHTLIPDSTPDARMRGAGWILHQLLLFVERAGRPVVSIKRGRAVRVLTRRLRREREREWSTVHFGPDSRESFLPFPACGRSLPSSFHSRRGVRPGGCFPIQSVVWYVSYISPSFLRTLVPC